MPLPVWEGTLLNNGASYSGCFSCRKFLFSEQPLSSTAATGRGHAAVPGEPGGQGSWRIIGRACARDPEQGQKNCILGPFSYVSQRSLDTPRTRFAGRCSDRRSRSGVPGNQGFVRRLAVQARLLAMRPSGTSVDRRFVMWSGCAWVLVLVVSAVVFGFGFICRICRFGKRMAFQSKPRRSSTRRRIACVMAISQQSSSCLIVIGESCCLVPTPDM